MRLLLVAAIGAIALTLVSVSASGAAALPDLRVTFLVDPPSVLSPGAEFSSAVRITNSGRAKAVRSTTTFALSKHPRARTREVELSSLPAPRLRRGHSSTRGIRLQISRDVPDGEYFLLVCADGSSRVQETDERHNCIGSAYSVIIRS